MAMLVKLVVLLSASFFLFCNLLPSVSEAVASSAAASSLLRFWPLGVEAVDESLRLPLSDSVSLSLGRSRSSSSKNSANSLSMSSQSSSSWPSIGLLSWPSSCGAYFAISSSSVSSPDNDWVPFSSPFPRSLSASFSVRAASSSEDESVPASLSSKLPGKPAAPFVGASEWIL